MRRALTAITAFALSLALTPPTALAAPEPNSGTSPRVGLVLAGGGARGLAHIGVIKYLEENNIQVHAIAGTDARALYDALLTQAQLWLHGHLHCPSDYTLNGCRVVANPLGYAHKHEQRTFKPTALISL